MQSLDQTASKMTKTDDLPPLWNNRHNQMSEHDMKLGGMAATKFSAKNSYCHHSHHSSDNSATTPRQLPFMKHTSASSDKTVPDFWESRQKEREIQGKQMGVFAKETRQQQQHQIQQTPRQLKWMTNKEEATTTRTSSPEAEVLLMHVATHALDALAKSLSKKNVAIPMEDRAAFATAVKEAMDALAKQS